MTSVIDYCFKMWELPLSALRAIAPSRAKDLEAMWKLIAATADSTSPSNILLNFLFNRKPKPFDRTLHSDVPDANTSVIETSSARRICDTEVGSTSDQDSCPNLEKYQIQVQALITNRTMMTKEEQIGSLLNLLLQADEDNSALSQALATTLSKLQTTRDELFTTKAQLQATQEQAALLLEERDSLSCTASDSAIFAPVDETGDPSVGLEQILHPSIVQGSDNEDILINEEARLFLLHRLLESTSPIKPQLTEEDHF